ncbi:MAG: cbb3-type cytochrome oxidase assembly protein CcoS [Pseudomonas sp.]|jgi:cbb3-type cytochrome oxidase maturation protein|uniref:cbb3-type cytochrome oxidase assembly protein CcoS n=1 Tax=Halopseudomonas sp. TaxID=2901191 RepID=UPI001B5AA636|nr:cbb3-type cytochrome oxidase assembly protein CcoS [Pseudomonas sp.]MBQ0776819.1 cbb3-type cytochrome oxidase assembly protein CcoS [Pseudomonas sp.]
MTFLYILVPVAVILVIIAIWVFNWAVDSGQYDDLDGPAHSILFDDEDPAHLAAQPDAKPTTSEEQRDLAESRPETEDRESRF